MSRARRGWRTGGLVAALLVLQLLQGAGPAAAQESGKPADGAPAPPQSPPADVAARAEEMQAAGAEAARRREREADLEERIRFRQELAAKRAAEVQAEEEKLREMQVVYGGVLVLKNTRSHRLLSGTNFRYFHQYGSGQNQVVTADQEDGYTHWRVMPRSGQRWELVKDVPVANGDVIRLLNMRTTLNLHSHKGPKSPLSGNNEVSNFGEEYGSMDPNDNWILDTGSAGTWHMGTAVKILHAPHQAELLSDSSQGNSTFGHDEVYCRMPPARKKEAQEDVDGGMPFVGEWMAKPVSGGAMNVGFDRWIALFEDQGDERSKYQQIHADGANGPKEISIYCPSNPVVSVSDLDYNLVSEGKCLALNLQSPHFEASLTLNCEPNNDKKKSSRSSKDKEEPEETSQEPDEV